MLNLRLFTNLDKIGRCDIISSVFKTFLVGSPGVCLTGQVNYNVTSVEPEALKEF